MQIGCATRDEHAIGLVKSVGYDYLEFSGKGLVAMTEEEYQELKKDLSRTGLRCECLTAYCPPEIIIAGPGFDPENAADYAKQVVKRAQELSVCNVSVGSPFSRNLPEGFDRKLAKEQACRFFEETARVFAPYGITVCVEPLGRCFCNFINDLSEAEEIIARVGAKNLGMVVDFYNMEQNGDADQDLGKYLSVILHAHISDDAGDPYKRDFMRPEKKEIHQNRVRRFYEAGYAGRISVEIDEPVIREKASSSLAMLCGASISL